MYTNLDQLAILELFNIYDSNWLFSNSTSKKHELRRALYRKYPGRWLNTRASVYFIGGVFGEEF